MRLLAAAILLALALPTAAFAIGNWIPDSVGMSNYSTFTLTTTTATPIIARNSYRSALFVQNQGSVSIVIKPGSAPANATDGIVIVAGGTWAPSPPFVDALYGISASSTAKVVMIEGAK